MAQQGIVKLDRKSGVGAFSVTTTVVSSGHSMPAMAVKKPAKMDFSGSMARLREYRISSAVTASPL
jgi:hypothetical protein